MAKEANGFTKTLPNADLGLQSSLGKFASQTAFTVSSTREPDMPIIYVSGEFCRMTGYSEKEILGRNCRFLQGPGTSRQSVQEIRNCIQEDRGCTVCMMNYMKDGRPFWNQLCLAPIRDENGIAFYLGIQTNVTGAVLAYRSQQFSPFQTQAAGPHGGVHSFQCPEIVAKEIRDAKELEGSIKRWHSEKLESISARPPQFRPVSSKSLPASLLAPLYKLQQSFVLVDPNIPDMPIVHASEGFLRLTGRPREKVIGHNCRFMQGDLTDQSELNKLREAIKEERPITVRILNYRANGDLFWNNLHVAPIRDADGKVAFFVGCQLDITLKNSQSQPSVEQKIESIAGERNLETIPEREASQEVRASENGSASKPITYVAKAQENLQNQLVPLIQNSSRNGPVLEKREVDAERQNLATSGSKAVPEAKQVLSPASKQHQRSVIGAVRVVCRSLSSKTGLRRSLEDQHLPHGMDDLGRPQQALQRNDDNSSSNHRNDMPTLLSSHI